MKIEKVETWESQSLDFIIVTDDVIYQALFHSIWFYQRKNSKNCDSWPVRSMGK